MSLLSELGDRPGAAGGPRDPERDAAPGGRGPAGSGRRRPEHRLHVRRADRLRRVRLDTARLARAVGLRNVFVTNGYETRRPSTCSARPRRRQRRSQVLQRRLLPQVLRSAPRAGPRDAPAYRAAGIWLEVTTLLIPGLNDDRAELTAMARWIPTELGPDTPWHLSRFFPAYRMGDVPPTPISTLRAGGRDRPGGRSRPRLRGQRPEAEMEDTDCAGCGHVLLERHGYRVFDRLGPGATCTRCGRALAGRALDHDERVPCG